MNSNLRKKQSISDCFFFLKDNIFLFLGTLIAVAICMYGIIGIFGFSAFPDEFGYWAPAAKLLGYDWSQVTAISPYYSYGYSAVLAPILFIFHDPITTYRAAVIVNLILQCLAFPMVYMILRELFPMEKKSIRSIATSIAVLYPAWCYYVQTTMTEALLNFGVILSAWLFLLFIKKPDVIKGLLLAITAGYLYMVHMRCVGIIGSVAISILVFELSKRKTEDGRSVKGYLLVAVLVILFAVSFALKDRIVAALYSESPDYVLAINDYSGLTYRLGKIFNLKGLKYLLLDLCGKVLYMGLATFGIAYFGIIGCIKGARRAITNVRGKETSPSDYLWLFILLLTVFQFMVALVFLNGASAPDSTRLDNFLHGRYIDFFLPLLIAVGIEELLHMKKYWPYMMGTLGLYLILSMASIYVILINETQFEDPHGFTMIGMSYLLEDPLTDIFEYFSSEVVLSLALTTIVFVIVIFCRRFRLEVLMSLILLMQVALGVAACSKYIFDTQSYIYGDLQLGDMLKELRRIYPDREIIHLYEGGNPYIELVQFADREAKIEVVDVSDHEIEHLEAFLRDDIILITSIGEAYEDITDDYFEEKMEIGHLNLYYTP